MSKPTDEEMKIALDEEAYMFEHNKETRFIAKTLAHIRYEERRITNEAESPAFGL